MDPKGLRPLHVHNHVGRVKVLKLVSLFVGLLNEEGSKAMLVRLKREAQLGVP